MSWELFDRKNAGGRYRYSTSLEWVTVFPGGIRLSHLAKEHWVKDKEFAEIYMDRETGRLAFKPLAQPTMNAYKISQQGDIKRGHPCFYIPCRAAITFWNKTLKGRHHCSLKETEGGLIELVPEA